MSKQTVLEFFAKVADDETLKEALSSLDEIGRTSRGDAVDKLVDIAAQAGFDFSPDDYSAVVDAPAEAMDAVAARAAVPYECTGATAWQGHPPDPEGCAVAWGCGVQHPMYGGPHIPLCATRPV